MEKAKINTKPVFFLSLWSEFANGALYLSELIWATTLFCILFDRPLQFLQVGKFFALIGFGGYFLIRLLYNTSLSKIAGRVAIGVWFITALLFTLKWVIFAGANANLWTMISEPFITLSTQPVLQSRLWQLIFIVFLYQRGFTLGSSSPQTWRTVRSFQFGMLAFFFYGLGTTWDNILANLLPFLVYLLIILLAMSTARLSDLSNYQDGRLPQFRKSWIAGMLLTAIGTVALGSLIGWLFGVVFINFSTTILNALYGILITVLVLIFSPLIALIVLLLPWLNNLVSKLVADNFGIKQLELLQTLNEFNADTSAKFTNTFNQTLSIVLILILIVVILAAVLGIRNRRRRNALKNDDEMLELVANREPFKGSGNLSGFFQSRLEQARRWLAAARIRRIYQQLMAYCEQLDAPRLPAFTPLEFLPQLRKLFPAFDDELSLLTNTYVKVRYGELPETYEEMQEILSAWEKIKVEAIARVKERKRRLLKK